MDILRAFYNDTATREIFKTFMISELEKMAVDRAFKKEPMDGIFEARELVDQTFNKLSELYEPPKKPKIESSR